MKRWILALMTLGGLAGCHNGTVPMIGNGAFGLTVQAFSNQHDYVEKLTESILTLNDSMLPALNQRTQQGDEWQLQLVAIGLEANASFGIGPFKFGISPGMRGFFTNQLVPPPLP